MSNDRLKIIIVMKLVAIILKLIIVVLLIILFQSINEKIIHFSAFESRSHALVTMSMPTNYL